MDKKYEKIIENSTKKTELEPVFHLSKKGKNYFGVCPFHDDTNPSMCVSREKQIYTCFSCHATGNVFTFLQEFKNISFLEAVKEVGGVMFICADHGNAEKMVDYETGKPHTAHTTNPVPFILVNGEENWKLREGGCLADIAPTLLEIMGLEQPAEMTGVSLLVK